MNYIEIKREDHFPHWANWLATDKFGHAYFHERKPTQEGCIWLAVASKTKFYKKQQAPVWESSLRRIK